MSEENSKDTTMTTDDLDILRVLLHSIRGISTVSASRLSIPVDDENDESSHAYTSE